MLSLKQRQFIYESVAKINIAHGAVRSGKTHASLLRFAELVIQCPDNKIIMIGNSFGSVVENAVKPLSEDLFRGYCIWQRGNQTLLLGDKSIRVIGAHDEGAVRAIQGNTHSLAYVDEMTTIPSAFIDMLTTRLSHDWSKLVGTCNPNSPVHPIKTKFIDCEDKEYCYSLHFEIDDNPGLTDKIKNDLKTKYSGLFYQRYILGHWVMAEGAIYADFSRATHVVPRAPGFAEKYYLGIDYGQVNPFAAVLVAYRSQHTPRFWVEKEFYWNPSKTFRQKTNSEFADDIQRFIEGYPIAGIYLDPSAESFQVELNRRKLRVNETNNDVFPGITFVANLISNHQLKVVESCQNLIGEMEMYVWDPKKALKGDEEPIKQNDHCFDGETLIHTERGIIPIKEVKETDRVLTREGYKDVIEVHDLSGDLYEFEIGGKTIRCTSDHEFFTLTRDWIKAEDLIQSDILVMVGPQWQNPKSLSLMEENTGDIQNLADLMNGDILHEMDDISIELFGNTTTEKFQKDMIYITKTGIRLTMICPIWNVWIKKPIGKGIKGIFHRINLLSNVEKLLKDGINLMKEENGIENTQKLRISVDGNINYELAKIVPSDTQQKNDQKLDSVRIIVNHRQEEKIALTMSMETASFVTEFLHIISTGEPGTALNLVPRKPIGKSKVYDLTVDNQHEYFANGILVHNCCDALRYAIYSAFGKRMKMDKEPIQETRQIENLSDHGFYGYRR